MVSEATKMCCNHGRLLFTGFASSILAVPRSFIIKFMKGKTTLIGRSDGLGNLRIAEPQELSKLANDFPNFSLF